MDSMDSSNQEQLQVDPDKVIKQLTIQRNSALDQAAQCVAVIEMLDEQLTEVADELAEAHKKIADLENTDVSADVPTRFDKAV